MSFTQSELLWLATHDYSGEFKFNNQLKLKWIIVYYSKIIEGITR